MDLQRNILIIAFLFVSFMVWQTWEQDRNSQLQQQSIHTATFVTDNKFNKETLVNSKGKQIIVKTDVLELTINTRGGDIEQALLLTYPKELKSNEPFKLLENAPGFIYQAQSGINGRDGPDNLINGTRPLYNVEKNSFVMIDGQNEIVIPMIYTHTNGDTFNKTFILKRGEYAINVMYEIQNVGKKPMEISSFGQLKQSINLPNYRNAGNNNFVLHTFRGAAYSTPHSKYEKYKFDNIINNENLNIISKGGWVAMLQQYFATAWIPNSNDTNNFYTKNLNDGIVAIGYKSQPILLQPGQTYKTDSVLWIGPEIQDKMATVAPHLDLTVDYGWPWFISQPLLKLLKFIYSIFGNWGFSIIIITFVVRGIMYPLTKVQYTSMAKMHMLQPKIQAIRERSSDNKQRQNHEMMVLYKTEKVNPLGGCFPLLIQMPIFLALYYMLVGSVELRHAPFTLWIHDLSAQDPYYILPILMGITMFFIQKISPTNVNNSMQQKVMLFMPVIFTIFFLWFPSGLVLYYIVSNLVTIMQQQLIYRGLKKRGLDSYKKENLNLFKTKN